MTRQELVEFLENFALKDPARFENLGTSRFVEAASAWIDGMDGYYRNRNEPIPKQSSWSLIADIFQAASINE